MIWLILGARLLSSTNVEAHMVSHCLDRGLCNHRKRMQFPEATVEHLVRRHFDHNPLLLRCSKVVSSRDGDYHNVVRNVWRKKPGDIALSLFYVAQEPSICLNN